MILQFAMKNVYGYKLIYSLDDFFGKKEISAAKKGIDYLATLQFALFSIPFIMKD